MKDTNWSRRYAKRNDFEKGKLNISIINNNVSFSLLYIHIYEGVISYFYAPDICAYQ